MKNQCSSFLCLFVALFLMCHPRNLWATENSGLVLGSDKLGWKAYINSSDGAISDYRQKVGATWESVPFRKDSLAGLNWEGVRLHRSPEKGNAFQASRDSIFYSITYKEASDHLIAECTLTNRSKTVYAPFSSRLYLGIDSEMRTFPDWDLKFFPTLLRCEKNYAWGYFMSPRQIIMGVGVEEPVASYALNYIYEGALEWKWGHQVRTASLDLLHCLPLPDRHPQNQISLSPGETKTWTIHLGVIGRLPNVKQKLSQWIKAPMIGCSRYTLAPGEDVSIEITSADAPGQLTVEAPDGSHFDLPVKSGEGGKYSALLSSPVLKGVYKIRVTAKSGKSAEACVYVRNNWSWYLKNARDYVAKHPPLFSNSC